MNRLAIFSGSLGLVSLLVSAPALAQDAPVVQQDPPAPTAPPVPSAQDAAAAKRVEQLEKRLADLEAKSADQAKREADEKAAALAKAAADKKQAADDAAKDAGEPFAFADFTWMPAHQGSNDHPLKAGPFTGELRVDTAYHFSFNHPKDNTISGSSEVFRHNELQLTQLGIGGDFLWKGVQARLMTQFGMYSQTTPRNDASPSRGQWGLDNAYRYISEAYGGYHFDVLKGINVQAGIFMSYIGLWSYYNADNWTYQPSYVSSNTPWFFNGARVQIFPTEKLKIEPWFVNGWQSYGKFNQAPGGGVQIDYRPTEWLALVGNQYVGTDTLGTFDRKRVHTDDSVMVRYYNNPGGSFSRAAASFTVDAGCEFDGGVDCTSQYFLGFMAYSRFWFADNHFAATIGGGAITNPGRYLVLMPPVNGATAASGTPYFTAAPNDTYNAWDMQLTFDWIPQQFVTFRTEFNHRAANVPYFSGPEGVTPPGGNQGSAGSQVNGWSPDLVRAENRLTWALMVKM